MDDLEGLKKFAKDIVKYETDFSKKKENENRRERMATAFLAARLHDNPLYIAEKVAAAIEAADLLIAELDKAK